MRAGRTEQPPPLPDLQRWHPCPQPPLRGRQEPLLFGGPDLPAACHLLTCSALGKGTEPSRLRPTLAAGTRAAGSAADTAAAATSSTAAVSDSRFRRAMAAGGEEAFEERAADGRTGGLEAQPLQSPHTEAARNSTEEAQNWEWGAERRRFSSDPHRKESLTPGWRRPPTASPHIVTQALPGLPAVEGAAGLQLCRLWQRVGTAQAGALPPIPAVVWLARRRWRRQR